MATITQTKLVGFGYGNKANYSATTYANHIWFDPTNKQILLNGIEYIPKKLSELVNDKNFLTSITKSMVENVLTGNITSHTHSYAGSSSAGGVATSANSLTNQGTLDTQEKIDGFLTANKLGYATFKTTDSNNVGFASNDGMLLSLSWSSNSYGAQIAFDDITSGNVKVRGKSYSWGSWYTLLHSGNYTSYAATKDHTHSFASITSKPTTLGGYGITDAALASDLGKYLPLTGGTLTGALTCNGDYINMNGDSGAKGYKGYFNQSGTSNRASGSHIFMGNGQALGSNAISLGYNAFAGIRNQDADKGTYPYIAWQWMPTEKINITINNQGTANGEFYGYEVLGGKMVQYELGGNTYTYENTSTTVRVLVCVKDDADTGLIFGGKSYMPFNATKTLIQDKYILGRGESITAVNTITVGEVNYYVLAIYTWSATVGYDYSTQVKVMCATKVNNSNYNGASSYASGAYSVASGAYSVASGYYSVASGAYSVASGNSSVASGASSVASGAYSVASGYYSVASGYYSVASGAYSVASGYYSVASHDFSVVLARNGETQSSYQTIIGRYNAKVAGLFIIGNGSSSARSNALVVDDSGNVTAKYFSGYANALGSEGIKVYANNSNEINFGGISSSTTIYFGFRSMDSRPTPTIYDFGKGNAIIQASSFTGNAATATNADTLDGYHASNLVKFYLSPMSGGAPADSAKSWFIDTMPAGTGAIVYNVPGSEKTIIAGKSTGAYGHMLQLNYDDNYLRILRYWSGNWKTTDWEKISAGYADTATALTSSAGSATQPIYFSNGKPVACSYTLGKSVPSNAVFTDTTYSVATASADGLMSSAMFKAQMVKSVGVQQGAEMMKPDGTITITDHSVYITQDKSNINGVYQQASGENDVKIPNATKDYDGSMSYTDKKKLDKLPTTMFGATLAFYNNEILVDGTCGDYNIEIGDATVDGYETIQENNHYITMVSFNITNNDLKDKLRDGYVRFGYSSKDIATYETMRLLQSNFDGSALFVEFIHATPIGNKSFWFDCIWDVYPF